MGKGQEKGGIRKKKEIRLCGLVGTKVKSGTWSGEESIILHREGRFRADYGENGCFMEDEGGAEGGSTMRRRNWRMMG